MKVTARRNEAARLKFTLDRNGKTVASRSLGLAPGAPLGDAQAGRARARRAFTLRLRVVATDAAGNARRSTRTLTVKR